LGWGKTTGGLGNGSPPAGSRGGAPLGGRRDEVLQKLNNFKSSYKQILRIFGSISHIFTYICLCFFRACRHHSTKSAKWRGHLIPFAPPLVCKRAQQCPLCSPRLRRLCLPSMQTIFTLSILTIFLFPFCKPFSSSTYYFTASHSPFSSLSL